MRDAILCRGFGLLVPLFLLAASAAGAEVTTAVFDVPRDQVDAVVDWLDTMDFAEVARPAATVLARPASKGRVYRGMDPGFTPAQWEAEERGWETPAQSVARNLWKRKTADPKDEAASKVLADLATGFPPADEGVRRVAIDTLTTPARASGTLNPVAFAALSKLVVDSREPPDLRRRAAMGLIHDAGPGLPVPPERNLTLMLQWRRDYFRNLPDVIHAQPTLLDRHAAFNDLTNLGNRLFDLRHDDFAALLRVGFELIEAAPPDDAAGAYGTARRLGYMLRRPDEFAPPQAEHKNASGNLADSFFLTTADNARRWWRDTGRAALDAVAAPAE